MEGISSSTPVQHQLLPGRRRLGDLNPTTALSCCWTLGHERDNLCYGMLVTVDHLCFGGGLLKGVGQSVVHVQVWVIQNAMTAAGWDQKCSSCGVAEGVLDVWDSQQQHSSLPAFGSSTSVQAAHAASYGHGGPTCQGVPAAW
jgi:hypothetical protein